MCGNSQQYCAASSGIVMSRNGSISSLSRNSSEFEFDFSALTIDDELPASPKFITVSPVWEISAASSSNTEHDGAINSSDKLVFINPIIANSPAVNYDADFNSLGISSSIRKTDGEHLLNLYSKEALNSKSEDEDQLINSKRRANLRSLMLQRRELQQLPQLESRITDDVDELMMRQNGMMLFSSSPSTSSSASSWSSSTTQQAVTKAHQKKSRKWSFKLDFLKKALVLPSSPKASHHHDQLIHDEMRITSDDYHNFNARLVDANHSDSAAASSCSNHESSSTSADVLNMGRRSLQLYDNFDYYPRQSTTRMSVSAIKKPEREVNSGANKRFSASAPVSPAASPLHLYSSHANGGTGPARPAPTGVKRPMSPHAQHYQLQRARAEELRRRTVLPYRHSLLGACFFHSPPQRSQVIC